MAKITANGHHEVARWRKPNGAELILTTNGKTYRLLRKWTKGVAPSVVIGVTFPRNAEAYVAEVFARRDGYTKI